MKLEMIAYHNEGEVSGWQLRGVVDDAVAIALLFPKAARVKATTLTRPKNGSWFDGTETVPYVTAHGYFRATEKTGKANENAKKRYYWILRAAARAGIEIEYVRGFGNSYATKEEFERELEAIGK